MSASFVLYFYLWERNSPFLTWAWNKWKQNLAYKKAYKNFPGLWPMNSPDGFLHLPFFACSVWACSEVNRAGWQNIPSPYLELQRWFATTGLLASSSTKTTAAGFVSFAKLPLTLCFWDPWCWHSAGYQEAAGGCWAVDAPCGQVWTVVKVHIFPSCFPLVPGSTRPAPSALLAGSSNAIPSVPSSLISEFLSIQRTYR